MEAVRSAIPPAAASFPAQYALVQAKRVVRARASAGPTGAREQPDVGSTERAEASAASLRQRVARLHRGTHQRACLRGTEVDALLDALDRRGEFVVADGVA